MPERDGILSQGVRPPRSVNVDRTEKPASLEFIEAELQRHIAGFDSSRKFYRKNHFGVIVATASLAALTTVLIGVGQMIDSKLCAALALVTSAATSVATAWEGFFRNREMWIHNTEVTERLRDLQADIRFARSSGDSSISPEQVAAFYQRMSEIIRAANSGWMSVRRPSRDSDRQSE